jgi:hypothetical protein
VIAFYYIISLEDFVTSSINPKIKSPFKWLKKTDGFTIIPYLALIATPVGVYVKSDPICVDRFVSEYGLIVAVADVFPGLIEDMITLND